MIYYQSSSTYHHAPYAVHDAEVATKHNQEKTYIFRSNTQINEMALGSGNSSVSKVEELTRGLYTVKLTTMMADGPWRTHAASA